MPASTDAASAVDALHAELRALIASSRQRLAGAAPQVHDPILHDMIRRITVLADPSLDARGHTAVDLIVTTTEARQHMRPSHGRPCRPSRLAWHWVPLRAAAVPARSSRAFSLGDHAAPSARYQAGRQPSTHRLTVPE